MNRVPADLVSGKVNLPVSQTAIFLLCPHVREGVGSSLGPFFYKGTNPMHKVSTLITWSPPKVPTSLCITLAVRSASNGF